MTERKLGVGVVGAHSWAEAAHLPGYQADQRAKIIAICDIDQGRAHAMAQKFNIPNVYADHRELMAHPDVEMVDVCTPNSTHLALSLEAIRHGKHVLTEKPLAETAAEAFDAAARAAARKVRTKLGFTFRYSPALRQIKAWIDDGTIGDIFHIHGLEQNYQFLDPDFPLRQLPEGYRDKDVIPASIIGYGSHLVDLMRWVGGEFQSVIGSMRNYVPERLIRGYAGKQRLPVEDGTVALVEYASGAQGMLQSSHVAIGNYPGVEIRVYGSKAAAVARLVVENQVAETLHLARADSVEFNQVILPPEAYPPGTDLTTPWPELYYRNLVRHYVREILEDGPEECTFYDGAKSQEILDAIIKSHFERRWIDIGSS